jgi:hypothetical protein
MFGSFLPPSPCPLPYHPPQAILNHLTELGPVKTEAGLPCKRPDPYPSWAVPWCCLESVAISLQVWDPPWAWTYRNKGCLSYTRTGSTAGRTCSSQESREGAPTPMDNSWARALCQGQGPKINIHKGREIVKQGWPGAGGRSVVERLLAHVALSLFPASKNKTKLKFPYLLIICCSWGMGIKNYLYYLLLHNIVFIFEYFENSHKFFVLKLQTCITKPGSISF